MPHPPDDSRSSKAAPRVLRLADYAVPDFLIDQVHLHFDLGAESTKVHARLQVRRNPESRDQAAALVLNGRGLTLLSLHLDGQRLEAAQYDLDPEERLWIRGVPDVFELATKVEIQPRENTALEGLYVSGEFFCTQCEAEGFRRITYYPDRPDVMARFRTTIAADKQKYPVLLSNGNLVDQRELDDGRHQVTWEDPHRKPCYLFALVAGDLAHIEDHYLSSEDREVTLRIYTDKKNVDKCDHAMRSLKNAMRWDEEVYGLACDLDMYSIVVTDDFNMGAMENKGLNIFNSKYVLARPETATDTDYKNIEGVIAHEYFHNWTGNRVTCRDWFQLSLKEGLTVFRDQQFSADQGSAAIQRIGDVRTLRTVQFPEDAGPMAHPVRPESVIEINNFYTVTIYEKGAEIVRMYQTLLGAEGFAKGLALYLSRHDGQAVTCDDFRQAMAEANDRDLGQFGLWYSQAGTPVVEVERYYDANEKSFTLRFRQSCPKTPGLQNDKPFHIPIAVGLLDEKGQDIPLQLATEDSPKGNTRVLELTRQEQEFTFVRVHSQPVPSLLRGASAPVKLVEKGAENGRKQEQTFLMAHDSDPFCRWDAGQQLLLRAMLALIENRRRGEPLQLESSLVQAFGTVLAGEQRDRALTAELLTIPGESFLGDQMLEDDPEAVHAVREHVRRSLAEALGTQMLAIFSDCDREEKGKPYGIEAAAMARRRLKNVCLWYLVSLGQAEIEELCLAQFRQGSNMTDVISTLTLLAHSDSEAKEAALTEFHDRWQEDPLVVDKWFGIQASSPQPGTLDQVRKLMQHPAFAIRNPNKVRALIGAFCHNNRLHFHAKDGSGYAFLAEQVLAIDGINPLMASRLVSAFVQWRRFDPSRQALMTQQLQSMLKAPDLSRDVYELASKALMHHPKE